MGKSILCFGAMHMDRLSRCNEYFVMGASNPASSTYAIGGVAFNIARNVKLRGCDVGIVSCVGNDPDGMHVKKNATELGIVTDYIFQTNQQSTASYQAILDKDGELIAGLSEMGVYDRLTIEKLEPYLEKFQAWPYWIVDANIPAKTIEWLCENKGQSIIIAAPVSAAKALRWAGAMHHVDIWIGNNTEAKIVTGNHVIDVETAVTAAAKISDKGPEIVIITRGSDGVVVKAPNISAYCNKPPTKLRDVNGAGDSFLGGFASVIAQGGNIMHAIRAGISIASITAENDGAVCDELCDDTLATRMALAPEPIFTVSE